ncbi:unnamed protein product [Clavelina lepadiformis]|uniref:CRAL-TRIO domain-containing protein n=1 Tax=Clavelina lepadiformis TaxID=159417 RepID=A0ABP0FAD3_CLALP
MTTEGERYVCKLSTELLEKAVKELNEPRDNTERLKAIDRLKKSYNSDKYGPFKRMDDLFFLRFLRARKFDHNKALKVLHKYHGIRRKFREVFDLVDNPSQLEEVMESGIMYVSEERTKSGAYVTVYRPEPHTKHTSQYMVYAYGQVCTEYLLEKEEYQICGNVLIDDFEHFDTNSVKAIPVKHIKKITNLLQEATPARLQSIHLFNEGTAFDLLFTLAKPFMKRRLTKHLKLHGKKYSEIYDEVSPTILPPCMGGSGSDPVTASKAWVSRLRVVS